jgi:hypothetical protein
MAPARDGCLQELRDEISKLVNAIAHGALESSPALADCLAQAELKLAAEADSTAIDRSGGTMRDFGRDAHHCAPPEQNRAGPI